MTVLLTGGAGYIGSHVAVELLQSGYDVIIADNFYNSSQEVPERIRKITEKSVRTYNVDIQNSAALEQIFKQHEINAVMHFAGYKAVGEAVQQPLKYYRGNLDSTLTLLETMGKYQVKNLIFSSSATVYGNPSTLPITEACPTGNIASPYGWTKYMIEQIITDYAAATLDFSAVIFRYFNPVGAHPSGLIGEAPNGTPNSLIRQITDAMETEIIPFPGGTMSLGDIERRLRELEQQFQTLLEKATDDPAAYGGQFKEILDEQTFLKEKRSGILADNNEQAKANQRIQDAAQTLENASPHITEWDESAVRQLVETVKVLSKDEIAITLKGGIEICQKIMY